jgi:hypothetical protein
VRRSLDQDLFEDVQARMEEADFRAKLSERMWKVEGLFAEAKQNHALVPPLRFVARSCQQLPFPIVEFCPQVLTSEMPTSSPAGHRENRNKMS